MKLTGPHLNALKAPLALLALAAILGAGVITYTRTQIVRHQHTLIAQESHLREARSRYQRSGDERDLIVRFMGPYQELQGRGLIGFRQLRGMLRLPRPVGGRSGHGYCPCHGTSSIRRRSGFAPE